MDFLIFVKTVFMDKTKTVGQKWLANEFDLHFLTLKKCTKDQSNRSIFSKVIVLTNYWSTADIQTGRQLNSQKPFFRVQWVSKRGDLTKTGGSNFTRVYLLWRECKQIGVMNYYCIFNIHATVKKWFLTKKSDFGDVWEISHMTLFFSSTKPAMSIMSFVKSILTFFCNSIWQFHFAF